MSGEEALRKEMRDGFEGVHSRLNSLVTMLGDLKVADKENEKEIEKVSINCPEHIERTTEVERSVLAHDKIISSWGVWFKVFSVLAGGGWAVALIFLTAYLAGWRP